MPEQPPPIPNDERPVWEQVMEDMSARNQFGIKEYGVALQIFNGRNALQDAYEESLDKTVYLKQALLEQERIFRAIEEEDMNFLRGLLHEGSVF